MKLSNLTFIVTDFCNFDCSYCFQKKKKQFMTPATIEKAAVFFYPVLGEKTTMVFYGGEPLLAFDVIQHTVSLFNQLNQKNKEEKKQFVYSLTTNGSLINEEMLRYFDRHKFSIMLSFDGLTQDTARKAGSFSPTLKLVRRFKEYPGIEFSMNSVFTPETVELLPDSLRFVIEASAGAEVLLSLSTIAPWDREALDKLEHRLNDLVDFLYSYYKKTGTIPIPGFRPPKPGPGKKGFVCTAGLNRMAVTPGENVWGCYLFHDYLMDKKESDDYGRYFFGKLDDFMENFETLYSRTLSKYKHLRQECFFAEEQFCFLCKEVDYCGVCPVNAAYSTHFIGKIPPWVCRINRLEKKARDRFLGKIASKEG
jgi:sulfatase maturation enzyme AslB (radical SAM superfamily)